jgi:hypothetical protein
MSGIVELLLKSTEPSVRYKTRLLLRLDDPNSDGMAKLQKEIVSSPRVKLLLSERARNGKIPIHPYSKWDGAHWVLAALADVVYPAGDRSLLPLRSQVYEWLLTKEHEKYTRARPYSHHPPKSLLDAINKRPRIHGSMEGNVIWYLLTLGLFDERGEELADRLVRLQWPDGGWNCDGDPRALKSSFMETLLPLRALTLHAKVTRNQTSRRASERASEVFLKRQLFKRVKNGSVIDRTFVKLHYPCYWHYDLLFGLKVMVETGHIKDPRCNDALDLLESKRLPDGGYPAEAKYYRVTKSRGGRSLVGWGSVNPKSLNEFVTVDALWVLKEAGRLNP